MSTASSSTNVDLLRAALAATPDDELLHQRLGAALRDRGELATALSCLRRAVALGAERAEGHYNLGVVLSDLGRPEEALVCYRRALALDPALSPAAMQLAKVVGQLALWDAEDPEALVRRAAQPSDLPAQPFTALHYVDDPRFQRTLAEQFCARMSPGQAAWSPGRVRERPRLRLGFFTSDMYEHPVAQLVVETFERLDRTRFETVVLDYGPDDGSEVRRRVVAAVDRFVSLPQGNAAAIRAALHDADCDIMVDLKGHSGHYAHLLADRPAPVQVNWLGYPGTLGAPWIDYIIADPFVVPDPAAATTSESVVWLSHLYAGYDTTRAVSTVATRADHGLDDRDIVLCCFSHALKIRPAVFGAWLDALEAEPRTRLWIARPHERAAKAMRNAACARGIDPDRIVFAPRIGAAEHIGRYSLADLALDTYPYASHSTSLDALYGGCPLLACVGDAFASRVAGAALRVSGLSVLVADGLDDYSRRLVELVGEPERLTAARQTLADGRASNPLFDTPAFVRGLERAWETIWCRHRAGIPPDHLDISNQ